MTLRAELIAKCERVQEIATDIGARPRETKNYRGVTEWVVGKDAFALIGEALESLAEVQKTILEAD